MPASRTRRALGWCAVAGSVLFTVASFVAWSAQDVYSPRREDISSLAAVDAQQAWIMIAGIVALGLGLLALGLGLRGRIHDGRSATVGPILLVLTGLSFVAAGFARNDCSSELQACRERVNSGDVSWHHGLHDLVGVAAFVFLVIAPLVFARAFRTDSHWSNLRPYSLATGVLALALLLVFAVEPFDGWNGLVQRILLAVLLVWVVVLGTRLAQIAGVEAAPRAPLARAPSGTSPHAG